MPTRGAVVTRVLQVGLYGLFVLAIVLEDLGAVVNAALALGVTYLPKLLERDLEVTLDPRLTLYVTLAVALHAVGMFGPYDDVWWWDHLTHTLSATVVAGVGYTLVRAIEEHSDAVSVPRQFEFVFVVLFTLALGVGWEVLEFLARIGAAYLGMTEILVQYGLEDTLADLLFDAFGAVAVALLGRQSLEPTVESLRGRLKRA
jgi:hypothetical protein